MGKSRNKSRSEVEYLRGRVRELEAQLKYYKKREHFLETPVEEIFDFHEVENLDAMKCPQCKRGTVIVHDFVYAILKKCDSCEFEEKKGKK